MQSPEENNVVAHAEAVPTVQNKSFKNSIIILIVIIVAILIGALAFFIGLYVGANTSKNTQTTDKTTPSPMPINPEGNNNLTSPIITIASPSANEEVDGSITVSGTATPTFELLSVEVFDDKNNSLARTEVPILDFSGTNMPSEWVATIYLNKSPATNTGKIKVTPTKLSTDAHNKEVAVKFKQQTVSGRVKLYSPLEDQIITGTKLLVRGEMQNFFEGHMDFRIKDEAGKEIVKGFVTAPDNYEKFSTFDEEIAISGFTKVQGKTGTFEVFDVSQADGKETMLLSFKIKY